MSLVERIVGIENDAQRDIRKSRMRMRAERRMPMPIVERHIDLSARGQVFIGLETTPRVRHKPAAHP